MTYFHDEDGSIELELLYGNYELISGKYNNGKQLNNAELYSFNNGLSINYYWIYLLYIINKYNMK